jgi:TonB-linked SusC/RagA family outer membrane protein
VAIALFLGAMPLRAQTGIVRGQVTDAAGQPLADVLVSLVGTNVSTRSVADGMYELPSVAPGTVTIRAALIGYAAQTLTVQVTAAAMAELNFTLTEAAISLDAMVVTATGEQRAVEVPNVITTVDAAAVAEEVAPVSLATLVQGRAPGVQIIGASGTAGTGTKVRIRGSSSLNLTNEPLLVVDGVRVDNTSNDIAVLLEGQGGVGGQAPSRINDLNPDEIESIEIIKGPSAAALYGTEAANGVIVVKTKRGRVGDPVWNIYAEGGIVEDRTNWPASFTGLDAQGDPCYPFDGCIPTEIQSFNVLTNPGTTPFQNGNRQQVGLNVGGGSAALQYFLSGEYELENGIQKLTAARQDSLAEEYGGLPAHAENPNRVQRMSLRANLNANLSDNTQVSVSTGYVDANIRLPQNDNNILGVITNGLMGQSDSTANEGWWFFKPDDIFFQEYTQDVQRFTQSVNANWSPTSWLQFRGTAGLDFASLNDVIFQAVGTGPDFLSYREDGFRRSDKTNQWLYTVDLGGTAQFRLTDRISSRTSVGVQYFRNYRERVSTYGEKLPPGAGSNSSATDQFIDEAFVESRTLGTFIEQQFGLDDRLYVTAAIRGDDNSAFGADFDYTVYPKLGASYLLLDRRGGLISDLRLRAAWGVSGVAPNTNDAVLFYGGILLAEEGTDKSGVAITNAGNTELKPERSAEIEAGFEAGLVGDRLGLDFTFYRRVTKDALIDREIAPSLGLTDSRFDNLAETLNYGVEAGVNGTIVRSPMLTWEFGLQGSTNTNRIVELGEGVSPILFGFRSTQAHKQDYPLGAFFETPYEFDDANSDGIITDDELTFGDSAVYVGYPRPRYEASLFNAINISSWLRISGLFDYRGGFKQYNYTEEFRCFNTKCEALNNPDASLEDQARAVAAAISNPGTNYGYIEDAWFIKLREVALTFYLPTGFARAIGSSRATLTLAGRNLLTITDYSGLDPEVQSNQAGNFGTGAFFTQPQVRYWTARLQLTF